ncbi:MAG: hypothetical protein IKA10_07775 [Oscillospiraceae bacterium]|nr:hypothetical protein [Oscillospiraceae bacterium]
MKKKLLSVLSLSLVFAVIFSICASAATPRWAYIGSISPGLDKYSDAYFVTVGCPTNVTKIEIELELYQKGILGIYSKKDSGTKTIYATGGSLTCSYDMDTNKTYRVDATVTVTTSSGQTETATVSHEG